MKIRLLTVIFLCFYVYIDAFAQTTYSFRHLTTDNGLSNNEVKAIERDNDGYVWIATGDGINRYDGYRFKVGKASDAPFALQKKESVNNWSLPAGSRNIDGFYTDKSGDKWIFSTRNDDIYCKKKTNGKWTKINIDYKEETGSSSTRAIQDDGLGNIWIATDHRGIFIYNKMTGATTNIHHDDNDQSSISEDNVTALHLDQQGIMWIGYLKKGLSYYYPSFAMFTNVVDKRLANLSTILKASNGNLWIGTDGDGLYCQSKDGHRQMIDIAANSVVTLMEDKEHCLWIGTYQHGLICYDHGTIKTFTTTNSQLSDNSIYSLCQDKYGKIWIGSLWGHLQSFNPKDNTFHDYTSESKDRSIAQSMYYDGDDKIYAGMLSGLCIIDVKTGKRKMRFGNRRGTQKFLQPNIQSIYRDSRGLLWMGCNKGLTVMDEQRDTLYYIDKTIGLIDNIVRGIAEDSHHRLWIATSNGASVVSISKAMKFHIDNYIAKDGLATNMFSRNSAITLSNGDIVLGGSGGYTTVSMSKYEECSRLRANIKFPGKPYEEKQMDWRIIFLCIFIPSAIAIIITMAIYRRRNRKFEQWKADFLRDHQPKAEVEPSKIEITSLDQHLLDKAVAVVEKNIADSDFTVEQLSEALNMTRGHLYKRLTSITGKSPSDFIRIIRLKRGRQLLAESQQQVSEIAYSVGFSSPKIFSRNFKGEFGMTPTEYMKSQQDDQK